MKKSDYPGRRTFLKTAALAAPGARLSSAQQLGAAAEKAQGGSKQLSRPPFAYPRTFSGAHLQMIAFPLGGVGTGCISLGGRGELRDWEIFNRPDKGTSVSYAFP